MGLGRTGTATLAGVLAVVISPAPAPAPAQVAGPLCGASFLPESPNETYQQAFERVNGYYRLESVRVFYTLPKPWPGKVDAGRRPLTVSFKAAPKDILAGRHDAHFRTWFADAPRDVDVNWTYFHEPEDNIARGEFTAADYRAAWRYLHRLAAAAGNPRLHPTLILMDWTVDPRSQRNWRDYYPGDAYVEVLAWDAYNQVTGVTRRYRPAEEIFGRVVAVSRDAGKPFAIAETGSAIAEGDDGRGRAAWLRQVTDYLTRHGARWVQYFDIDFRAQGHSDYRLRDAASQRAWREFCAR
ncbi:Glycosyl hydrolase family 26 [Amycolatopsis arida]|uniref:Glycosyl hydrolase family 26 n=1 Tax=Amycolatopsis arida TaxID=587909 RepID=A0A1I5L7E9_9PSEU|nr:glycosyl hydrolase [Amycolatopsis arida]TDX93610.1 glycosyl hydrolase family 26 [Amycolatopsis arida]SFO93093.1 Glycosyl hydrolase family 26 [Amycolatopsis arida]